MTQPVTWTARTAEEALNLIRAAEQRIESALRVAYPDYRERVKAQESTEVHLSLSLDATALEQLGVQRHTTA